MSAAYAWYAPTLLASPPKMKIFSPAEVKPKLSLLLGKSWNCIRFTGPSHDRFMAWVVYLCKASITQSTIEVHAISDLPACMCARPAGSRMTEMLFSDRSKNFFLTRSAQLCLNFRITQAPQKNKTFASVFAWTFRIYTNGEYFLRHILCHYIL